MPHIFNWKVKGTENFTGSLINPQNRLCAYSGKSSKSLLTYRLSCRAFRAEFQLSDGNRGKENLFASGDSNDVSRSKASSLHINPYSGIDQDSHGSRTSPVMTSSRRLSVSQFSPASCGRVRYRSANASAAVMVAGPGIRRATGELFRIINSSSCWNSTRLSVTRKCREKSVAVTVFINTFKNQII